MIYGIQTVKKLLKQNASIIKQIYIADSRKDQKIQELIKLIQENKIPLQFVEKKILDKYSNNGNHQGIIAQVQEIAGFSEKELFILISQHKNPLILILDGVQDPHNLGAILRTAEAAGVLAVVLPKDNSVGLTPVVRKVSSGASELIPFVRVGNLSRFMRSLQDAGVWIVGAAASCEKTIYNIDFKGPVALALGAEGTGLRQLTMKHCDYLASIPMLGSIESLNVSVATGVCLYEVVRQRSRTP